MDCQEAREKIQLFLDGELTENETQALKKHVIVCRDCAVYMKALADTRDAVRKYGLQEPPEDLHMRIMTTIQQDHREEKERSRKGNQKRIRLLKRWTAVAAAGILLAVGGFCYQRMVAVDCSADAGTLLYADDEQISGYGAENEAVTEAVESDSITGTKAEEGLSVEATTKERATAAAYATTATTTNRTTAVKIIPPDEYDESLSEETLEELRAVLDDWTSGEISVTGAAGFVCVARLDTIPPEADWLERFEGKLKNEDVSIALCRLTGIELDELLEKSYPYWTYLTRDGGYFDHLILSEDVEIGVLIVLVPVGA